MSNRVKYQVCMWMYLTLVSYFFGVVVALGLTHSTDGLVIGSALLALVAAQVVMLYLLTLIRRTE